MDVYTPEGDTQEARPLVVIAHGGFFLAGSNDGVEVVSLCEDLAQMGYVVASMSYRLGVNLLGDLSTEFIKAVWRGVHDSRAAVRFFRHSVDYGNPWAIDTNRIYLGGSVRAHSSHSTTPMWMSKVRFQPKSMSPAWVWAGDSRDFQETRVTAVR